jgi:hypothetical protein
MSAPAAPILKYVRACDPFECVFALQIVRLFALHASARFESRNSPGKEQQRPIILHDVT